MVQDYFHPLDPLSAAEIEAVSAVVKGRAKSECAGLRFNTLTLMEPTKKSLLEYEKGNSPCPPRQAVCLLQTPPSPDVYKVIVQLDRATLQATIISWELENLEGGQLPFSPDDCFLAEEIVKKDATVISLLNDRYGIKDLEYVACDPWSVHDPPPEMAHCRLIQTFLYLRSGSMDDNQYSHPIDLVPIVDLLEEKVLRIDDPFTDANKAAPIIPKMNINYHRNLVGKERPLREDIKPLSVIQPEGPSWSLEGNLIKWQKWYIRHSFNPREGLVIHDVKYNDGGKLRPILNRMSLVEMAVPYADPRPPYTRKCAFDVGDYGLGNCTLSLDLGCDCLGTIHYFDGTLVNSKGEAVPVPKAVCMHEEDSGILWKHVDYRTGHNEVRRSRKLVLSFTATVVNYEYNFRISFYQDGTITFDIQLTGELSTNLLSPNEAEPTHGVLVAPSVNAQSHQHMFSAYIDMAVDDDRGGKDLVVTECEADPVPEGPDNPYGNAFLLKETPLMTELEAQRVCDASVGRFWKIKNPNSIHPSTKAPVAWKLVPQQAPLLLSKPTSAIVRRGMFATKNVWVTPHSDTQRFPAGEYPTQSTGGQGLAAWTAGDRALSDPVIFYTFGTTHFPRPEDFPVMPVEMVGFTLKPAGFFEFNPAIDIPSGPDAGSTLANGCCSNGMNGIH